MEVVGKVCGGEGRGGGGKGLIVGKWFCRRLPLRSGSELNVLVRS